MDGSADEMTLEQAPHQLDTCRRWVFEADVYLQTRATVFADGPMQVEVVDRPPRFGERLTEHRLRDALRG